MRHLDPETALFSRVFVIANQITGNNGGPFRECRQTKAAGLPKKPCSSSIYKWDIMVLLLIRAG